MLISSAYENVVVFEERKSTSRKNCVSYGVPEFIYFSTYCKYNKKN